MYWFSLAAHARFTNKSSQVEVFTFSMHSSAQMYTEVSNSSIQVTCTFFVKNNKIHNKYIKYFKFGLLYPVPGYIVSFNQLWDALPKVTNTKYLLNDGV